VRHKLFDGLPDDPEAERVVGQELALDEIYRTIKLFALEGRADRLILTHGPNGSSKTTIADMLFKGLEAYSQTPEGALYRFVWIFPKAGTRGRGLGFARSSAANDDDLESYAWLPAEDLASVLPADLKTNPVYLIPREERREFLYDIAGGPLEFPHVHILRGDMGTKSRTIFEALLADHKGNWREVMRYVRVERFKVSRRYRLAAVTIEPQGNVDAEARQVTADMNLANLPPSLQNLKLFEVGGDLIEANRGLVEYSDFLKRPLEYNKYLLTTSEKGTVRLPHLDEFKEQRDFTSFKGRIELIPVPYLLEYEKEVQIYRDQLATIAQRLVIAPHAARTAALWAILTRLMRPDPEHYDPSLRATIERLTPLAKALLYQGRDPSDLEDLTQEEVKRLRDHLPQIAAEHRDGPFYEGRFGASPREMKSILLDASYRTRSCCFTPMAVLSELRDLVKDKTVYDFLRLRPPEGVETRYHDPEGFVDDVERALVRVILRELKESMGLVAEEEYDRRFEQYFLHVIAHTRGTRVTDPVTGDEVPPDPKVLTGVEALIDTGEDVDAFRKNLISRIGAFSVGHPGEKVRYRDLFPDILRALKRELYTRQEVAVREVEEDFLLVDTPAFESLKPVRRQHVETTLRNMESQFGYPRVCALEMVRFAVKRGLPADDE